MAVYAVRRLSWAAVLVIAVTLNAFMLFYVVPTEDVALGGSFANVTEDTGANRFSVDRNVVTGYLRFLGRIAHGDLGQSWRTREDVVETIFRAAPATASLVVGGALIWIGFALVIGIVSALRPRSLFDRAGMVFVLIGVAAQPLWLGYVMAYVFGYRLGWFPISGYCDFLRPQDGLSCGGPVQWTYHLLLPWLTFACAFAAMYARMVRANLLEATHEDYVRTARAKGLSEWGTVRHHTFRNAMLPIIPMAGMDVGLAFAGSLFVERAFGIPGVGTLTITSLQRRDLPILLGVVVLVSLAVVVCNLIADLVLGVLDPRIGGPMFRFGRAEPRAPAPVASEGGQVATVPRCSRRLEAAAQRAVAQGRHLHDRLDHDRPVHLRLADPPVDEGDRDLDDAEPGPQDAVGRLDLEAVALGADLVQVDPLQNVPSKALESACQVANPDAQERTCVEAARARDQDAADAPVDGAAALRPAGAEGQVGAGLARSDQAGHVLRIVGEVAVDLEHELGPRRQGPAEPRDVGGPKALLGGAMQHVDPGQLGRERIGDRAGAVGRVVVDHENAVAGGIEHSAECPHHRLQVLALVVRGETDQSPHPAILPIRPDL